MAFAFSSSSTQYDLTDNSSSNSQATTIGDLSSDNKITYGDYVEQGLVGENLSNVLDAITTTAGKTVDTVQETTAKAIEATGQAYAESLLTPSVRLLYMPRLPQLFILSFGKVKNNGSRD